MKYILVIIGIVLIYASLIAGFGHFFYLWAFATDLVAAKAAWIGFTTFLKMVVGGYGLIGISMFLKD